MPARLQHPIMVTREAQGKPGPFASGQWWRQAGAAVLDLIFPPRCAGCGRVDHAWCPRCDQQLRAIPIIAPVAALPSLHAIAATANHEGLPQRMLWSLKYENNRHLAIPLGERLAAAYSDLDWPVDFIIPVPMHAQRLKSRGYNQAGLLADTLAGYLTIPCQPHALQRTHYTRSQVGLNREDRQTNMADAFVGDPALLEGSTILLIDDVYTTGATLAACAAAATDAGASTIYGLTVTAARG